MPLVGPGQVQSVVTIENVKNAATRVAIRTVAKHSAAIIQAKAKMGGGGGSAMMPIPRGEMVFVLGVPADGDVVIDNKHGDSAVEATVVGIAS